MIFGIPIGYICQTVLNLMISHYISQRRFLIAHTTFNMGKLSISVSSFLISKQIIA